MGNYFCHDDGTKVSHVLFLVQIVESRAKSFRKISSIWAHLSFFSIVMSIFLWGTVECVLSAYGKEILFGEQK